jgi:hypothetical protein
MGVLAIQNFKDRVGNRRSAHIVDYNTQIIAIANN